MYCKTKKKVIETLIISLFFKYLTVFDVIADAINDIVFFRYTLNEVLSALEENDREFSNHSEVAAEITISILPPEEEGITDEDSDGSDDEITGDFTHLPRRILNSTAHTSSEVDIESEKRPPHPKRKKKRQWKTTPPKTQKDLDLPLKFGPKIEEFLNMSISSPMDAFLYLFSSELVDQIIFQSKLYAEQRGRSQPFTLSKEEFLTFVGILVLSGYAPVPYRRLFWSNAPDVHNDLVAQSMRRNKFEAILQNLHFADNTKIDSDRYYKIRPLFTELNKSFKLLAPTPSLSIDESMIKYYGKHSTKQFIRGKPIRFGFKLFSMASPAGYLYHAEPYCGSDTQLHHPSFGLGGNVVLTLAQVCDVPEGSKLFFDNWFTSLQLLDELKSDGIGATGTIRADRCCGAPLNEKKELQRLVRGSASYASDGSNVIVRWYDNAVVSVATNCFVNDSIKAAPRWSRKERKKVLVSMPEMIHSYNRNMGGVDLFDQFIANYRIKIRSKKWWWPFFSWSIDACIVNGWLLYQSIKTGSLSLLDFRREVAQQLLK